MSYVTNVRRACNIGSVYHANVVRGCVPLSASSSLIYPSGFSNTITAVARRSCRTHENSMHAEKIIIIFYIFFYFLFYVLVLFSIVLYRTIVTVYTDNIFLYNYVRQMRQIINLLPLECFTPARVRTAKKLRG